MTLTRVLVPTYTKMLSTLSAWLTKAEQELSSASANALLSARLDQDMFPLATQIRLACVQAQEAAYRLRKEEFPPTLNELLLEGCQVGAKPGTLSEAQTRIAETVQMLSELRDDALDNAVVDPSSLFGSDQSAFDTTAQEYAQNWVMGRFHFHMMIVYSILRANGLPVGKAAYPSPPANPKLHAAPVTQAAPA